MNAQRSGAAGLLGAAVLGIVAAPVVPRRYGRRGGLGVLGGVSMLLVRDVTMALTEAWETASHSANDLESDRMKFGLFS